MYFDCYTTERVVPIRLNVLGFFYLFCREIKCLESRMNLRRKATGMRHPWNIRI